jgi:hypothetical protein
VRLGLGAAVALVLLVVLIVILVDGMRSEVGDEGDVTSSTRPATTTVPAPATAGSSEPVVFDPVLLPSGMVVAREWRLAGNNGDTFIATIDVFNGTGRPATDAVVEVIPKDLASSVEDVEFFGATPVVIVPDPIVRFDVSLETDGRKRIGYRVKVPPDGSDPSRVLWWKASRDAEEQAFEAQLTAPPGGRRNR